MQNFKFNKLCDLLHTTTMYNKKRMFKSLNTYKRTLHVYNTHAFIKWYLNPEKYTIKNKYLCKMKFCINHKSDNGILWKKLLDDKSHQVCLQGGRSASNHHGNHRKYSVNTFYLWFVVCYFCNDFRSSIFINWLIRVQKHIHQEECDVLPLSTWSTEVFNLNRIKNWPFLLTDCCWSNHHR